MTSVPLNIQVGSDWATAFWYSVHNSWQVIHQVGSEVKTTPHCILESLEPVHILWISPFSLLAFLCLLAIYNSIIVSTMILYKLRPHNTLYLFSK